MGEALLEDWGRKCIYCGIENVPLQIEHIKPKSKNGSNTDNTSRWYGKRLIKQLKLS